MNETSTPSQGGGELTGRRVPFFSLSLAGGGSGWGSRSHQGRNANGPCGVPAAGVGAPPSAGLSWGAMTAIPFPDAIMRNAELIAVRLA